MNYQYYRALFADQVNLIKSSSFSQALSQFVSLKTIAVAVVLNTSGLARSFVSQNRLHAKEISYLNLPSSDCSKLG